MPYPKKSLGQNFLRDNNIAKKIVESFHLNSNDIVIEIGPGKGILTQFLLEKTHNLTVIEIDNFLVAELHKKFENNITIIHNDILSVDIQTLTYQQEKFRVIGNIPYNITSPILFHLLDSRSTIKNALLMMQTEVAERLTAKPRTKAYGILSVFFQYYATSTMILDVSPSSFFPVPSVNSTVILLDFEKPFPEIVKDDVLFRKVVRGTFNQRRKMLRNSLSHLGFSSTILEQLNCNLTQRPEELSVQEFIHLTNQLSNIL